MAHMDERQQLSRAIKNITNSGQSNADPVLLREIKSICKRSDVLVQEAYKIIFKQLHKKHAEVRLSAFQIINEMFNRSHCFREAVLFDLRKIIALTLGIDSEKELPPPRITAEALKRYALKCLFQWRHKFRRYGYTKLEVAYSYLHLVVKIDWEQFRASFDFEVQKQREELEKIERKKRERRDKLDRIREEISSCKKDILDTLAQVENCFRLLLLENDDCFNKEIMEKKTDDDNKIEKVKIEMESEGSKVKDNLENGIDKELKCETIQKEISKSANDVSDEDDLENNDVSDDSDLENDYATNLRLLGVVSGGETVAVIDPNPTVQVTRDNTSIVDNLHDLLRLIHRNHLPRVHGWLQAATEADGDNEIISQLIDVRNTLESAIEQYDQLNLRPLADSDDDMDDFEEVQPANTIEDELQKLVAPLIQKKHENDLKQLEGGKSSENSDVEQGLSSQPSCSKDGSVLQPSSSKGGSSLQSSENLSKSERHRRMAPKLDIGSDIVMSGVGLVESGLDLNNKWVRASERGNSSMSDSGLVRVKEFVGEFVPVEHSCGARLPSGRLCPRRDRVRCPLHGPIIDRDQIGLPIDEELRREEQRRMDNWQDPKLLARLKAETGLDLKIGRKRRGLHKKSKLSSISVPSTVRSRLEKIVFNRSSVKRVASALDRIDHNKHRNKFNQQFNY